VIKIIKFLKKQGEVALKMDPAAKTLLEAIVSSPSIKAIFYHRIASKLYGRGFVILSRLLSQRARRITGIEIHPGAKIGEDVFIDHGMGVVIGETAVVGNNVLLYHGVTLGGIGGDKGSKRHPTLEDDVVVGSGAKVLGPVRIGKGAKIGANAVVLKDIPPYTTAVGIPARILTKSKNAL